jgi:hypothetical protein
MAYLGVKPAGITSATEAEIAGDLTVDTSTLKVDATNNRVGVGVSSPNNPLEIAHTGDAGAGGLRIGDPDTIASDTGIYLRTTGDAVIGAAGGEIVFDTNMAVQERFRITDNGVTFNGDTAAANALGDYEIGTFAGTIAPASSGSYSLASTADLLNYTKIGRQVLITGELQVSAISSPSGNHLTLSGLPFTIAATTDLTERSTGMTLIYPSGGSPNVCAVYAYSGTAVDILKDASVVGVGTSVTFQFTYIT